MSGFSADWLALREPFDRAARGAGWAVFDLQAHAARWRAAQPPSQAVEVLDLACGTGANLRALAPRLGGSQRWRLVDRDAGLLAAVPQALADWAQAQGHRIVDLPGTPQGVRIDGAGFRADVVTEQADLAHGIGPLAGEAPHLVTASALLDLVSAAWLDALVHTAGRWGSALLFALSVDGRCIWEPVDPADAAVHRLFDQHQRRDKGFGGPALGLAAVTYLDQLLKNAGYGSALQARSDWDIVGRATPAMYTAMVEGMAAAAAEQAPTAAAEVQQWKARRLAGVAAGRLTVGHTDLMALPARRRDPGPTTGPVPWPPR